MNAQAKENIFDEQGNTIGTIEAEAQAPAEQEAEVEASDESDSGAGPQASASEEESGSRASGGKFRIGDKVFNTQKEALAYAESRTTQLETETQIADAYRQGIRDAMSQTSAPAESVTPQAQAPDELDPEELYTNPQSYTAKLRQRIKAETLAEVEAREQNRTQSDQIWHEFTSRHPMLADFRGDVENFTAQNLTAVQAIIATKGRPAAYDYVATKIRSDFERKAAALKPKRELPNTTAGASPSSKAAGVTPKTEPKKALSLSEQLRSIRSKRR